MKFGLPLAGIAVILLLTVLTGAVLAHEGEVPPPYAGMKSPFPWDDPSAQGTGKATYQRLCQGCHGVNGANIAAANFSLSASSDDLEKKPDFHFWLLSEGALSKGMPAYKSTLSEEQRWQVLAYLWSLGKMAPEAPKAPAAVKDAVLRLEVPARAESGEPLTMKASLQDSQGRPVAGAAIKFFVKADFFTSGLMAIDEALTDSQGVAVREFIPRHTGEIELVARYETTETIARVQLPDTDKPFYHQEVGIDLPVPGEEKFFIPEILAFGEEGFAPPTVLRLPTGSLAWLAPLLWAAMAIWAVYFFVLYQVFRISVIGGTRDANTRRIPLIGMIVVTLMGIMLVLMLITSPLSHPPLP